MRHDGQLRRRLPVSFVTLSRVRYGGVACLTARRGHILVQSACSRERRETVWEFGGISEPSLTLRVGVSRAGTRRRSEAGLRGSAVPSGAWDRGKVSQPSRAGSMKIAPLLGLLFLCLCYFLPVLFLCLFVNPGLNGPDCSRICRLGSPVRTGCPVLDRRPALVSDTLHRCWPRPDAKPLVSKKSI